jgi:hypothetical protein
MAEPTLTAANITFHTNDEDKDDDTLVYVSVQKGTTVAADITDRFGHFNDHSDAGPFDLLVSNPLTREELRTGNMTIGQRPPDDGNFSTAVVWNRIASYRALGPAGRRTVSVEPGDPVRRRAGPIAISAAHALGSTHWNEPMRLVHSGARFG